MKLPLGDTVTVFVLEHSDRFVLSGINLGNIDLVSYWMRSY